MAIDIDRLWEKLCNILQRPDLLTDPRFNNNGNRTANVNALTAILNEVFSHKTISEWLVVLEAAELPCAPINSIDKIVNDPHIAAREMIVEVEHPVAGHLKMAGVPVKMSLTPGSVDRPAPLLGQHTAELLKEVLGWDEEKTAAFFADK